MKTQKGFTLIELLVVIAIIGILAAVTLSSLNSARARARDAQRVSDMRAIQTALEMYYIDNGQYPDPGNGSFKYYMHPTNVGGDDGSMAAIAAELAPYIDMPTDPIDVWPYNYWYWVDSTIQCTRSGDYDYWLLVSQEVSEFPTSNSELWNETLPNSASTRWCVYPQD